MKARNGPLQKARGITGKSVRKNMSPSSPAAKRQPSTPTDDTEGDEQAFNLTLLLSKRKQSRPCPPMANEKPAAKNAIKTERPIAKKKAPVRKMVMLREEHGKKGSRYFSASYRPGGNLIFEGQDLGAGVREVFGFFEYEWVWTVHASSLPALKKALGNPRDLLLALKKNFSNDNAENLDTFLADHNITYEKWNRIGD
jgi:hypothetical protein